MPNTLFCRTNGAFSSTYGRNCVFESNIDQNSTISSYDDASVYSRIHRRPALTLSWLVDAKYTILQNQRSFLHQLMVETVFSSRISIKTRRFQATTTLLSILGIHRRPALTLSWLVDAKYTILQNQRSFFHQLMVETVFSSRISIKTRRFQATTTLLSILGIIDDLHWLCHD
jgi:hypothetical protein